ncbi:MXAN_2561 family MXYO-CTERM-anchored protein [Corallococcus terminator]
MRLTFAVFLLFASTALGQTQTVTFTATGTTIQGGEIVVSQANCSSVRQVTWTRTTANLCDTLYLWLSADTCSAEPGASSVTLDSIAKTETQTTGVLDLKMSDALSKAGTSCEAQTENKTFKLCASVRPFNSTGSLCETTATSIGTPSISFILDPKAPNAPELPGVTGLDGALSVSVTSPSDSSLLKVEVVELVAGDGDGGAETAGEVVVSKEQTTDNTVFRMEGLENEKKYGVRAFALDKAGNQSGASPLATGSPIPSNGFYAAYRAAGGEETGGCGAGGGGLALGAVVAALGFWVTSRRKLS